MQMTGDQAPEGVSTAGAAAAPTLHGHTQVGAVAALNDAPRNSWPG